ncbi:MAG: phosphoribosylglycinamide formyltransferase [Candidatus Margulisiibacteriota bacterium]|nr:phosphoribosylglycinamide formyltransferase [Candidatus Margulisiibacteriota bacterium]
MTRLAILISGTGTNMQAIIDACERKEVPAQVTVVISDKPDAPGLERAKKHRIPAVVFEPKDFPSKDAYELEIVKELQKKRIDLVCLAGYMRIVGPTLLSPFKGRMINIHPALLPSFPGLHAQQQAFDYGVTITGATVHFVDDGVDTGPIIVQSAVPVKEDDTVESLSARILAEEHRIYPKAIKWFAEGKLTIEGRKVKLR